MVYSGNWKITQEGKGKAHLVALLPVPSVRLRSLRGNPRKGQAWSPDGLLLRFAGKPQRTEMIFSLHACCVSQGLEETIRVVPSNESGDAPAHNRATFARWLSAIKRGMAHLTSVAWSGLKRIGPYLTCRCLEDSAVLRYHNKPLF